MSGVDADFAQANPLEITVEIQFVAAFHQSTITQVAAKNLSYDIRARDQKWSLRHTVAPAPPLPFFTQNDQRTCPNRVYNSWGTRRTNPDRNQRIIPYNRQPLDIVGQFLHNNNTLQPAPIFSADANIDKNVKTNTWYRSAPGWKVTNAPRVTGVGSQNITKWLPRIESDMAEEWDSYGLELICPIFSSDDSGMFTMPQWRASLKDVFDNLNALKDGDDQFRADDNEIGAFITNQCALHVNIVAPNNEDAVRVLANLLILYEEEIARMHPPCRRPYHPLKRHHPGAKYHAESNRLGFVLERVLTGSPGSRAPAAQYQGPQAPVTYGNVDVSFAKIARKASMQQIRDSVRSGTKVDFARLMNWPSDQSNPSYAFGNVNRQMNFIGNADRDGQPAQDLYPNFIQFRQARGSLDATDVERWVEFCCRLVWLAGLIAEDPAEALPFSQWFASVAGNGAIQRSGSRLSILDLLSRMNFPADTTMYWKERIAKFACYTPGDADDRVDDELPPAGYTYPSQGPGGAGGGGGGGDGGAGPLRDPPGDDEDDEDDDGDNGDNASPSRRVNINPTSRKRPAPHRGETPAQKIQRKADWRRGRVRTPSPPPSRPPTPEIAGRRLPPGGRGTAPKETPINKDARQIAIELNQAVRRALAAELEAQRLAREGVDAAEIERRRREAEAATDRERLRLAAAAAETEAEVEAAREMRRLRDEARVAEETERLRLAAEAAAEDPEAAEETERLRVAAAEAAVSTQPTDVRLEDGTLVYIPDDFYNGTMGLNPDAITEVSGLRILWDDLGGPPKKPTAGQDAAAPALTLNPGESDTSLRRRCIRAAIQQIIDAFVASERAAAAIQSAAEAAAARQDLEDAASERSARPDLDLQVPAEGMIAPVGVIAEEEEMRFDGFSWQVANFNLNRWNIRDVSSRITNRAGTERRGVCGIRSVIEAMRLQYPDDPLGQITPVALLERFTEMRRTSGERPNALITDVELNQLLFEWTGGRYSVVVYDMNAEFPEELRAARRVGTPEEQARQSRNLFLIYGPHTDGAIGNEGGHWQALQRK